MPPSIQHLTDLVEVGRGGFGTVYRAYDQRFGRRVAVKVIRDAGVGPDVVARFERECLALGSLSGHPNIVALHDSGATDDGDLFLVMEFLGGGSFTQRLASRGLAEPLEIVTWGAALCGALETAHRAGIVHRDVKPENVLFSDYGVPKLVDFGIARMRSAYETRTGSVSATLGHAAPEIVAGARVTPAADVYSLASVLHTMLAGRAPFDRGPEDSVAPLIARIASAPPPDLRQDGVPDAIATVVERGLAKSPDERYAGAAAMGLALRDAARTLGANDVAVPLGEEQEVARAAATVAAGPPTPNAHEPTVDIVRRRSVATPTPAPPAEPRRRRTAIAAAAAVATVAVVGGWALWPSADLGETGDGAVAMAAPSAEPTGAAAGSVTLAAYTPPATSSADMDVQRRYEFTDEATRVRAGVSLTNATASRVVRYWAEVIPKELAADVSAVSFRREPTGVIDADPIVYWRVALAPGASVDLAWSTRLPEAAIAGDELLTQVVAWHDAGFAAKQGVIDEALSALIAEDPSQVDTTTTEASAAIPLPDPGVVTDSTVTTGGSSSTTVQPPVARPSKQPTRQPSQEPTKTPTKKPTPPPVNQAPVNQAPVVNVSDVTTDELESRSFTVGASDPNGNLSSVSVSGLPAGVDANGASVSGTVSANAISVTGSRSNIESRSLTVSVTARDTSGASTTRTFVWTVRDTHIPMPDYVGSYGNGGDGKPDVAALAPPNFTGCVAPGRPADTIARQSVSPGTPFRWGSSVQFTYIYNSGNHPAC